MTTCTISGPLTCPKWSFGSTRDVRPTRPTRPEPWHPEPRARDDRARRWRARDIRTVGIPVAAARRGRADTGAHRDGRAGLIGDAGRDDLAVGWVDRLAGWARPDATFESDADADGLPARAGDADARADRERHADDGPAHADLDWHTGLDRPPGAATDAHPGADDAA